MINFWVACCGCRQTRQSRCSAWQASLSSSSIASTPAVLIALRTHLALAQLHGMSALVRVGSAEPALVLRALDAGAEGVIVASPDAPTSEVLADLARALQWREVGTPLDDHQLRSRNKACHLNMPVDAAQRILLGGDDQHGAAQLGEARSLVDSRGLQTKLCVQGRRAYLIGHLQCQLNQVRPFSQHRR